MFNGSLLPSEGNISLTLVILLCLAKAMGLKPLTASFVAWKSFLESGSKKC